MARPTSKLILATLLVLSWVGSASAQDAYNEPNYNDASRSDFISLNAGDANRANIAIQTPTPWPSYVNDTDIDRDGVSSQLVIEEFFNRHVKKNDPQTVINIGTPGK
jgi:hypothetical protein